METNNIPNKKLENKSFVYGTQHGWISFQHSSVWIMDAQCLKWFVLLDLVLTHQDNKHEPTISGLNCGFFTACTGMHTHTHAIEYMHSLKEA